ncbi:MAG: head-tail adaptor protein [Micavibrio sp.]|nr:head-tail adaptor protein [Micavibrio sp.]
MTQIHELRHVLSLQECVRAADGGGGTVDHWQDIANNPQVFAAINSTSGRVDTTGRQLAHINQYRITLRYRDDITPQWRLRDEAFSYRILALRDVDGRQAYLEINAERDAL